MSGIAHLERFGVAVHPRLVCTDPSAASLAVESLSSSPSSIHSVIDSETET